MFLKSFVSVDSDWPAPKSGYQSCHREKGMGGAHTRCDFIAEPHERILIRQVGPPPVNTRRWASRHLEPQIRETQARRSGGIRGGILGGGRAAGGDGALDHGPGGGCGGSRGLGGGGEGAIDEGECGGGAVVSLVRRRCCS